MISSIRSGNAAQSPHLEDMKVDMLTIHPKEMQTRPRLECSGAACLSSKHGQAWFLAPTSDPTLISLLCIAIWGDQSQPGRWIQSCSNDFILYRGYLHLAYAIVRIHKSQSVLRCPQSDTLLPSRSAASIMVLLEVRVRQSRAHTTTIS